MTTSTVVDQIIQVIEYLCQKFGIAIDWSQETLLPIAEHLASRIVNWCVAMDIFWISLCGVLVIAGIVGIIISIKNDGDSEGFVVLFVFSVFAVLGFGVGLCVNIFDLVKCLTFPELKILEYIQSFMQ